MKNREVVKVAAFADEGGVGMVELLVSLAIIAIVVAGFLSALSAANSSDSRITITKSGYSEKLTGITFGSRGAKRRKSKRETSLQATGHSRVAKRRENN